MSEVILREGTSVDNLDRFSRYNELYKDKGIVTVACFDKRPVANWSKERGEVDFKSQIERHRVNGLAMVGGSRSGGLEGLDIDTKNDPTGTLSERFLQRLKELAPELFNKLPIAKTPSGGLHIYYRCSLVEGNTKLAYRPATSEELTKEPRIKKYVLIETRGEGGVIVTFPTPGYNVIYKNPIPVITDEERELLFNISRSFNEVEDPVYKEFNREYNGNDVYEITPWDSYNNSADINDLLIPHGWVKTHETGTHIYFRRPGKNTGISADFSKQKRLFKSWSTNTDFEPEKAYTPAKLFTILECSGDSKEACKRLEALGFGKRNTIVPERNNRNKNDETGIYKFWAVDTKGKISIISNDLLRFINQELGIGLYLKDKSGCYTYVRNSDSFIDIVSIELIKKLVRGYVDSLPETFDGITRDELHETIIKGSDSYFSKSRLEFLNRIEPDFLTDTETQCFKLFRNGVIEITATSVKLRSYKEFGKCVWKSSVIDFDIELPTDVTLTGDAYTFLRCICGEPEEEKMSKEQVARLFYLTSLLGYILHEYKDPSKPFAVILAEETEDSEAGGGAGKGLLTQFLSKLCNAVHIDGKSCDPTSDFAYQRADIDTRLILLQDTPAKFPFEKLFNAITDGLTVNKKNQPEFFIPPQRSPKFVITTNHVIDQSSNAAKRRQKVFEFSSFFNPRYTPEMFFGRKLFEGWNNKEWSDFYNLMFHCIRQYLDHGIEELAMSDSINKKLIRQKYEDDFAEWFFDDFTVNGLDEWKPFKEVYESFLSVTDRLPKGYSSRKFSSGLKDAALRFGYKLEERKNRQVNNRKEIKMCNRS